LTTKVYVYAIVPTKAKWDTVPINMNSAVPIFITRSDKMGQVLTASHRQNFEPSLAYIYRIINYA